MNTLIDQVRARMKQALQSAYGGGLNGVHPGLTPASNAAFGDYQSNVAMTLSKDLKQPPRAIAGKLVENLDLNGLCEVPEIAGPGFVNFTVSKSYVESQINAIKNDARLGIGMAAHPRKIVVDMSSPNMAKEMHVGHLRSTIIGESLARTLEFAGHDVLRLNHVGDWGTQFGMLIAYLKEVCPAALTTPEAVDLGDLVTFYKQAKKRFDDDAQFQDKARNEVVALQAGNPDNVKAWQLLCEQSRREFNKIYQRLDIQGLTERGESIYNPLLADVVTDLKSGGLLVEDQGAQCVFVEGFTNEEGNPLPLIVQKKDGGYNYATTDLASIRYRLKEDKADELIYVVDAGQSDHLQQVFAVARKAGWVPADMNVVHVPFGVVQGEDGKKLKTRAGETVKLKDLLDEAISSARQELESRLKQEERQESEEFKDAVAEAIGMGAVKYADLSLNRITNYVFSFKKMLSLQGNTAPYMLYAYVRVQGISRKGGIDFENLPADKVVTLQEPTELALAKHILRLDETLESTIQDLMPNRICEYLFELSQKFNQFYESCPVLNADEPVRTSRLILCNLTARTIKTGLSLLGISVLERM